MIPDDSVDDGMEVRCENWKKKQTPPKFHIFAPEKWWDWKTILSYLDVPLEVKIKGY